MRKMFSENQIKEIAGSSPEKVIEIVNEGIESGKIQAGGNGKYSHRLEFFVHNSNYYLDGRVYAIVNCDEENPFTPSTFTTFCADKKFTIMINSVVAGTQANELYFVAYININGSSKSLTYFRTTFSTDGTSVSLSKVNMNSFNFTSFGSGSALYINVLSDTVSENPYSIL